MSGVQYLLPDQVQPRPELNTDNKLSWLWLKADWFSAKHWVPVENNDHLHGSICHWLLSNTVHVTNETSTCDVPISYLHQ